MPTARRCVRATTGLVRCAALAGLFLWCCGSPTAPDAPHGDEPDVVRVRQGASGDVTPPLSGPALLLQGAGRPSLPAFTDLLARIASASVDVVVLAASTAGGAGSTPECDLLVGLANVNSCETVTITAAAGAMNPGAVSATSAAEAIYFAGGNQCRYLEWQGSPLMAAVRETWQRGGAVGGGSAGLAIQGEVAYSGCTGSVTSDEALRNPYDSAVDLQIGMSWDPLTGVITDSHFVSRDRMGRLMSFISRTIVDTGRSEMIGLGVDDGAAIVWDVSGLARLFGGVAYLVAADHLPERCTAGRTLEYRGFRLVRLSPGSSFTLAAITGGNAYRRDVIDGRIIGDPYVPE